MQPRVGVKAIVMHSGLLIVVKKVDEDGAIYSFPGGGVEAGETLAQAIRREFLEEVGREVQVGDLLFVREYIGKNHEYAVIDAQVHVVDHLFLCTLAGPSLPFRPMLPDPDQAEVAWLPVDRLAEYPFHPRALIPLLIKIANGRAPSSPVYVGDIN